MYILHVKYPNLPSKKPASKGCMYPATVKESQGLQKCSIPSLNFKFAALEIIHTPHCAPNT